MNQSARDRWCDEVAIPTLRASRCVDDACAALGIGRDALRHRLAASKRPPAGASLGGRYLIPGPPKDAPKPVLAQNKDPCERVLRVEIPDVHGCEQDEAAVAAFLEDLEALKPDQIVQLGDLVDCAGQWTTHARSYVSEMRYSYRADVQAARRFLHAVRRAAPDAAFWCIEGNHELRIEKTLSRIMSHADDAEDASDMLSPSARLGLSEFGITHIRMQEFAPGLTRNGAVKIGNCHYLHGAIANKHTAAAHVAQFGANVVFGHTHRAQEFVVRTVAGGEIGAYCPGTLSKLQPLWMHTNHTDWSHGYGISVDDGAQHFHYNIPIRNGKSGLRRIVGVLSDTVKR